MSWIEWCFIILGPLVIGWAFYMFTVSLKERNLRKKQ